MCFRSGVYVWVTGAQSHLMPCSGLSAGAEGASTQAGCLPPPTALHTTCTAPAGHNKWSKVKLIKGPRDVDRSWLFQKLAMPSSIEAAIKGGVRSRVPAAPAHGAEGLMSCSLAAFSGPC
uniref:Uncharacterized protein n=1 Tax=Terrapene triunguis TaxID=2587831 RepID=A0A674JWQ6_9SAUR